MEITAIVVDDEASARNVLTNLIGLQHPQVKIVAQCSSLVEAVSKINQLKPDVVFLDIEMPQHAGYEIIRFIKDIDFHLVFVTAYDKFAIKAFEINALDYLLKPVERNRLASTISAIEQQQKLKSSATQLNQLLKDLELTNSASITFAEASKTHILKTNEIIAISAQRSYSDIILVDNRKLTISKNIGTLEKEMEEYPHFFRSHKSWIINTNHVQQYNRGAESIIMTENVQCKLSRFKKNQFEQLMNL